VQFGLIFGLMTFYTWFRKTFFQQPPEKAYANALDIIDLQAWFRLPVERIELPLQRWAIDAGAIDFFNIYYRQFKPMLYIAAMLALLLAPAGYRRVRRIFLLTTAIAFPMYALYPLAPPRLMTEFGFPFVDTVAIAKGVSSTAQGAGSANLYAAMPSMHIGWTTVAALWIAVALPWRRIGAAIGVIHLTIMGLTVMITGNHYWLDIAGGLAAVALAWLIARQLPERISGPRRRYSPPPDQVRRIPSGT
ncbi:MAG: phosphatase PAP2 family protein, partial [Thermomicrobiales bacterium]|nr:phosphatase PAP2 family protein [Thermomicrobiales bacterium]